MEQLPMMPHREHRRRRLRRRGRRAMIRGVYFLPSLATLGNAISGFAAIYVCTLTTVTAGDDPITMVLSRQPILIATYLVVLAAIFDALDGRLARMTRHTTDFGGQLDSLSDVLSFGTAPAFIALIAFKTGGPDVWTPISRLVWGCGALFVACAALRLAKFNVVNEHGEQHHMSFLGLPTPGAGLAVVSIVMLSEQFRLSGLPRAQFVVVCLLPMLLLAMALLMVGHVRYPHAVNRMLRGRKSMTKVVIAVVIALLTIVEHRYMFAIGCMFFVWMGPANWLITQWRRRWTRA